MSWAYTEDASGLRGHLDRLCVPRDEDELRAILSDAATQRIPLTVAGGGTGLAGGRVPFGGWVISTEKFRRLEVRNGVRPLFQQPWKTDNASCLRRGCA